MKINYIKWDGKPGVWDTDHERYYLIVDKRLESTDGSYLDQCAMFYGRSPKEVKRNFLSWIEQHPAFVANWREAGARIVKAPCAWDAKQINILTETL